MENEELLKKLDVVMKFLDSIFEEVKNSLFL